MLFPRMRSPAAPLRQFKSPRVWWGLLILTVGMGVLVWNGSRSGIFAENPPGMARGQWIPESELSDQFRVIGLDAHKKHYFILPDLSDPAGKDPAVYKEIEEQMYWLNFRFSHGDILTKMTGTDELYVAVPDPREVTFSFGGEKDFFKNYLRYRRGWTEDDIRKRVRFFPVANEIIWTQDACEMVSRAGVPGVVMYCGSRDMIQYPNLARGLAAANPEFFQMKELPRALSAEGGDLEVVWGPDRKPALLLGYHRVLDYLVETRQGWDENKPVTREIVEEARRTYSEGFGGLPVIIVPEKALSEPSKASKEIFHLDMLVSVMDAHQGPKPHAFVPIFANPPVVDAFFNEILSPELIRKASWEFDEAASQMAALGYEVVRLPFNDHPARSPVNFGKYRDGETGQYVVLAAKYPYHLPFKSPQAPQAQLRESVEDLAKSMERWNRSGAEEDVRLLREDIEKLWQAMDYADSVPNPFFDERARRITRAGYQVKEVHCFSWGSGGIHCQLLK